MTTWQQITDEFNRADEESRAIGRQYWLDRGYTERGPAPTEWAGLEGYWAAGLGCTAQMARQWQRYGFSPVEAVEYHPILKSYNDSPAGTAGRRQYMAGVAEVRDMLNAGLSITVSTIGQYMRKLA